MYVSKPPTIAMHNIVRKTCFREQWKGVLMCRGCIVYIVVWGCIFQSRQIISFQTGKPQISLLKLLYKEQERSFYGQGSQKITKWLPRDRTCTNGTAKRETVRFDPVAVRKKPPKTDLPRCLGVTLRTDRDRHIRIKPIPVSGLLVRQTKIDNNIFRQLNNVFTHKIHATKFLPNTILTLSMRGDQKSTSTERTNVNTQIENTKLM